MPATKSPPARPSWRRHAGPGGAGGRYGDRPRPPRD